MINHRVENRCGPELIADISSLSPETTFLDLAAISLFSKGVAAVKDVFSAIHPMISDLDLSDNELVAGTEESFSGLPANVNSLYLWFNELYEKSGFELKVFFAAFTKNISYADLSYNKLGYKRGYELKEAFSGFPPTLTAVRLSNNHFSDQKCIELEKAFSGFPSTLTTLDFSDDKSIKYLSNEQLIAFLKTIPKAITSIDLSHNKLFKGKTCTERDALLLALKEIDPDGTRLNLAHNAKPIVAKAIPAPIEPARPKAIVTSILQQLSSQQEIIPQRQVSKYSFFNQVNSVKEPAPVCDNLPKP